MHVNRLAHPHLGTEVPDTADLAVGAQPPTAPRALLRMVGLVRSRAGAPIPDARLDWWHPADDSVSEWDDPLSEPTGTALTCERGSFDLLAGDPDEHVHVLVRAAGFSPLTVRLVPLPGLPAISPPITRSGRSPLAVRAAGSTVECWCEFALTPDP